MMPEKFIGWAATKFHAIGYEQTASASSTLFSSLRFEHKATMLHFSVIYLKARIDTDVLRYMFGNISEHLLIVVDASQMGEQVGLKEWFRALHALYYGRVYVWDNVGILPVHYDRKNGLFSNGGYVEIKRVRFERVDCLYGGFKGLYNVVLLQDRKFWTTDDKPPATPNSAQADYEQFWRDQYEASDEAQQAGHQRPRGNAKTDARKQEHYRREQAQRDEQKRRADEARQKREQEDVFRDFKEAFERNKRTYGAENGGAYDPNAQPQYTRRGVQGDKWFIQIWSDGTIDGCKAEYRKLARKYHPDINKEPGALETMKAINLAYEKAMHIHEQA